MDKVKVYSTPACPYCYMVKDWLKEKKVPFDDINVAEDKKAAEEMVRKSGSMGVPQIEINGKIIVGFNKPALEKELAAMKK